MHNAESAKVEISKLSLPTIFFKIWNDERPIWLAGYCAMPKRYFLERKYKFLLSASTIPLFEINLDELAVYDKSTSKFAFFSYDSGVKRVEFPSYQRFVTSILIDLVNSGVYDELEDAFAAFEYLHAEEFKRFADQESTGNSSDEEEKFLAQIS